MAARHKKHSVEQVLYDAHNHYVNINLRDIYVHSHYRDCSDDEPGVDYRQATTFIKNLHVLDQPTYDPILVHLISDGGSWEYGMAMFNAVQFSQSYITILAYSQASSMSGIFLQSAPLRVMMPDCYFMVHYGSWGMEGPAIAVKTAAEFGNKSNRRMIRVYAERCVTGKFFKGRKSSTVEAVARYLDKMIRQKVDWYMDAEEAVYYGFADGILGSKDYPDMECLRSDY